MSGWIHGVEGPDQALAAGPPSSFPCPTAGRTAAPAAARPTAPGPMPPGPVTPASAPPVAVPPVAVPAAAVPAAAVPPVAVAPEAVAPRAVPPGALPPGAVALGAVAPGPVPAGPGAADSEAGRGGAAGAAAEPGRAQPVMMLIQFDSARPIPVSQLSRSQEGVPRPVGPLRPVEQVGGAPPPGVGPGLGGFRPPGAPGELPKPSGIIDALAGGTSHRRVDRRFALQLVLGWPEAPAAARATRAFLVEAVQFAVRQGVTQFVDLGSGTRPANAVHVVALRAAPASQTVYVEPEPAVVARALPWLPARGATVINADPRHPAQVFAHPRLRARLDLTRPVAVVAVPALPTVADDEDPRAVLAGYHAALAPGSLLIFVALADEGTARGLGPELTRAGLPGGQRPHARIVGMLRDWTPLAPGLVPVDEWQPPDEPAKASLGRLPVYAAVSRR